MERYEPLGLGEGERDGVVYVPAHVAAPAPLLLLFHGHGGTGRRVVDAVRAQADHYGVVVAAPDSRGITWDIIQRGGFGPDVAFLEEVMRVVPDRFRVDSDRFAMGGISDGASYALSIGPRNDCRVIAFSPGFAFPGDEPSRAPVFISHGTRDPILPFDSTYRLVGSLQRQGFPVAFLPFNGGHTVPADVADAAFAWWLGESHSADADGSSV